MVCNTLAGKGSFTLSTRGPAIVKIKTMEAQRSFRIESISAILPEREAGRFAVHRLAVALLQARLAGGNACLRAVYKYLVIRVVGAVRTDGSYVVPGSYNSVPWLAHVIGQERRTLAPPGTVDSSGRT